MYIILSLTVKNLILEMLYLSHEFLTNNFQIEVLDILSLITVISGISVIISKNPIISLLFLILLFGGVSSYLIFIGMNFIGLSYLIIYIGAVSILFLFILMLIDIRTSELQNNNKNSLTLAIIIGIIMSFSFLQSSTYINEIDLKKNIISFVSSNDWNGNLIDTNHISNIGNILYTNYNIWLFITGFILLLAMTGTIVITLKNKNTQ